MIFVDTGPLLAWYYPPDDFHAKALEDWGLVKDQKVPCVTTDAVLCELSYLLKQRAGYFRMVRAMTHLSGSRVISVGVVDAAMHAAAAEKLATYDQTSVDWTDCLSFAFMEARGLDCALSYDEKHFGKLAKFKLWPAT